MNGIPPKDLLEEVAEAWKAAGLNVDDCFKRAAKVTGEWVYIPGEGSIAERLTPRWNSERTIPLKHRKFAEVLNPQPEASVVIHNLLDWIDRLMSDEILQTVARPPLAPPPHHAIVLTTHVHSKYMCFCNKSTASKLDR